MPSPFNGVLVWIHDIPACEGGNIAAIVARLQQNGCAGALVKVVDGVGGYNNWQTARALLGALKKAGLSAVAWGYNYGSNEPGEASAAIQAIQYMTPDAYVFDAEAEVESLARPDLYAINLTAAVSTACPGEVIAYAPIGSIRNHLRAPYRQFADAGCPMLPQTYYAGFGWTPQVTVSEFYADVATYQLAGQPIFPAYEDAPLADVGSTLADVQAFCALVKAQGAPGVSVWDYQNLDANGWQRVAVAAQAFPLVSPQPDYKALYLAEQTRNAALVAAIESSVATLQGALS